MRDKYIGLDVHQATISIAVLDSTGKVVIESVIETKAHTILQFFQGLRGNLHVTFEEGASAAWLYDLLKPYATTVLVCDTRKNALLKSGNKDDQIDARKLATLLRGGLLSPVYHGENGVTALRELARSYLTITKDLTSTMNRLKALYRSRAIPCVIPQPSSGACACRSAPGFHQRPSVDPRSPSPPASGPSAFPAHPAGDPDSAGLGHYH